MIARVADQADTGTRGRPIADRENPWPGPEAFNEAAAPFFNGREDETAELRRLVMSAPLTVLFGASGLGKTSLIQAGLFPAIRADFLPIYVSLRESAASLGEQLKAALQKEISLHQIDAPAFEPGESLWRYLHRRDLELWSPRNQLLTPLFVLDQFEEVFTFAASSKPITALRLELADLVENRVPQRDPAFKDTNLSALALDSQRYKLLISFREDFLPRFEAWKRQVPSIMRNRFRLLPMSPEQAFQAVHMTSSGLVDAQVAARIVKTVAAAQEEEAEGGRETAQAGDEVSVEPFLLSIFCHGLNEKRKARGKSQIDQQLLDEAGSKILEEFYLGAVGDQPERVRWFVANELITAKGFRNSYDVGDALAVHKVTRDELNLLVNRRLLRIEPHGRSEHVELTHDVLTPVVRGDRARWQARERAKAMAKRTAVMGLLVVILGGLAALFAWRWRAEQNMTGQLQTTAEKLQKAKSDLETTAGQLQQANQKLKNTNTDLENANKDLKKAKEKADEQARIATQERNRAQAALQDWRAETLNARTDLADSRSRILNLADEVINASHPLSSIFAHGQKEGALSAAGKHAAAIQELTSMLEVDPNYLPALSTRGYQYLLVGRPQDSIRDSEAYLAEVPRDEIALLNLAIARAMLGPEHYAAAKDALNKAIESYDPTNSGMWEHDLDPDIQAITGRGVLTVNGWEYLIALRYELAVMEAWAGKPEFARALEQASKEAVRHPKSISAPLLAMNWAWLQARERPADYGLLAASGALWESVAQLKPDLAGCAALAYAKFERLHSKQHLPRYDWLAGWVSRRKRNSGACMATQQPDPRELAVKAKELEQISGNDFLRLAQVQEKLSRAIEAVSRDPMQHDFLIELLIRRARIRYKATDYIGLREDCNRVLWLNRTVADAYYYLALSDNDPAFKLRHFEAALKYAQGDADTLSDFAEFLSKDHPDRALVLLEKCRRFRPHWWSVWRRLAELQLALHRNQEALQSLNKAITLSPTTRTLYQRREIIERELGVDATLSKMHLAKGYRSAGDAERQIGHFSHTLAVYLEGLNTICSIKPTEANEDVRFDIEQSVRNLSGFLEAQYSKEYAVQFWQTVAANNTMGSYKNRAAQEVQRLRAHPSIEAGTH